MKWLILTHELHVWQQSHSGENQKTLTQKISSSSVAIQFSKWVMIARISAYILSVDC